MKKYLKINNNKKMSFYVILPSNTRGEGNCTNSFKVRLPKKLKFNSEWSVGLSVMVYPYSWPSLGTTEDQFVQIFWRSGETLRLSIPASKFRRPQDLEKNLSESLTEGSAELVKKLRNVQIKLMKISENAKKQSIADAENYFKEQQQQSAEDSSSTPPATLKQKQEEFYEKYLSKGKENLDDETKKILKETREFSLAAWVEVYRQVKFAFDISYDLYTQRFQITLDDRYIEKVELSTQLSYILGFTEHTHFRNATAKFMPDMSGGVSSFFVYAPGLIEPVIIGDSTAPLLRIVTIRGEPDQVIEDIYVGVQYHKLLIKEVSEIEIEIRTTNGNLMPFDYGNCVLTLHFKKMPYF